MMKTLLACGLALVCAAAFASGGDYAGAVFVHRHNPGDALAFNGGRLGILLPTYERRHLVVAYRWLNGLDVNEQEARLLQPSAAEMDAVYAPDQQLDVWLKARNQAGAAPINIVPDYRGPDYETMRNCAADAFRTATRTLLDRQRDYGSHTPAVRLWLQGQDAVFANCGAIRALPAAVPIQAPAWLRRDRAYQIAATHYYRGEYQQAAEGFAAIAADPESPWRQVSTYLVARSRTRQAEKALPLADVARLRRDAAAAVERVLQDAALAAWHLDAIKLRARIVEHGTCSAELEQAVLAPRLSRNAWQEFQDFLILCKSGPSDLSKWLRNVRNPDHANALTEALKSWRQQQSRAWLLAGLWHGDALGKIPPVLLQHAATLRPEDPAYLSANFHHLGALRVAGQHAVARELADTLLALRGLDGSARNLLLSERSIMAPDLGAFLRDAQRRPVEIAYPGSENGYPGTPERLRRDPDLNWRSELKQGLAVYFDLDTTRTLNAAMPYATLRQAAAGKLPRHLRRVLLTVAFTRSVLLGKPDAGLAARLSGFYPQIGEFSQMSASRNPDERRFQAALALLKLPGASPLVEDGLGRLSPPDRIGLVAHRWWDGRHICPLMAMPPERCGPLEGAPRAIFIPPFLQEAGFLPAQEELRRILEAGTPAAAFGRVVLDRAAARPSDPRLPEALHLVVRAGRFGSRGDGSSQVSKAAFRLLHTRYKATPWAARTPLWYGDDEMNMPRKKLRFKMPHW